MWRCCGSIPNPCWMIKLLTNPERKLRWQPWHCPTLIRIKSDLHLVSILVECWRGFHQGTLRRLGPLNCHLAYRHKQRSGSNLNPKTQAAKNRDTSIKNNIKPDHSFSPKLQNGTESNRSVRRKLVPYPKLYVEWVRLYLYQLGLVPHKWGDIESTTNQFWKPGIRVPGPLLWLPVNPLSTEHLLSVVNRRMDLCCFSKLTPAGPHGLRPGHQTIVLETVPQAWLQGKTPVTLSQAESTGPLDCYAA